MMTAIPVEFLLSSFNFYYVDHVNMCGASTIAHSQHLTNTDKCTITHIFGFRHPHIVYTVYVFISHFIQTSHLAPKTRVMYFESCINQRNISKYLLSTLYLL